MLPKFLELVKKYQSDIFLAVCVALLTFTAFNLGKMSAFDSLKTPVSVLNYDKTGNSAMNESANLQPAISSSPKADLSVVASSKSSGKLYHFKWCPGAGMISPANLLTFPNEAAAIAAGYKLASNCQR